MVNPFKFFALVFLLVFLLILAPTFLLIIPIWWPVAWILGRIFPGHDFMPLKKIFSAIYDLVARILQDL